MYFHFRHLYVRIDVRFADRTGWTSGVSGGGWFLSMVTRPKKSIRRRKRRGRKVFFWTNTPFNILVWLLANFFTLSRKLMVEINSTKTHLINMTFYWNREFVILEWRNTKSYHRNRNENKILIDEALHFFTWERKRFFFQLMR